MKKITVTNIDISISVRPDNNDYICLTDMAHFKDRERTNYIIQNWMRLRSTIDFLGLWEKLNNPNFKGIEFDAFKMESGTNSFTLTPKQWIEKTKAMSLWAKVPPYRPGLDIIPIALVFSIHCLGVRVKLSPTIH